MLNITTFSAYPKNPLITKLFIELGWVDQLGSGVLNVNKFISEYAEDNNATPQFIEDIIFKTVLPILLNEEIDRVKEETVGVNEETVGLNEETVGVNEETVGVNKEVIVKIIESSIDGINASTQEKLAFVLNAILQNEGKRIPAYTKATKLGGERTMERYMQQLRDANLIVFKGESSKTGGYFLTDMAKAKITEY